MSISLLNYRSIEKIPLNNVGYNRIITIFARRDDVKTTEFHKLVQANGWEIIRQSGSHVIYRKGLAIYPVPYHGAKELGNGLEKKMRKEMGLKNL